MEGLLHDRQAGVAIEVIDRFEGAARDFLDRHEAALDERAVDKHRAGSTLAGTAAFLIAGKL
ncbi:MAG TPA: hypothetical protein VGP15_05700 [Burkholderiales bacterium]|nr:hypothetical protein [Burkholderiales bacterium]